MLISKINPLTHSFLHGLMNLNGSTAQCSETLTLVMQ